MKLSMSCLGTLCSDRGISLARLLADAGVSRNAFYSLARKTSVLPNSIRAIAAQIGVNPSAFLEDGDIRTAKAQVLLKQVDRLMVKFPDLDRDNARHMLILLEEAPEKRLRRALQRAQKPDIRGG